MSWVWLFEVTHELYACKAEFIVLMMFCHAVFYLSSLPALMENIKHCIWALNINQSEGMVCPAKCIIVDNECKIIRI